MGDPQAPDFDAEWEAHKAVDKMMSDAKIRAEARPLTSESVAIFHADIKAAYAFAPKDYGACACSGKNPGEPLCRCAMARVLRIDGRYHLIGWGEPPEVEDLGPVRDSELNA